MKHLIRWRGVLVILVVVILAMGIKGYFFPSQEIPGPASSGAVVTTPVTPVAENPVVIATTTPTPASSSSLPKTIITATPTSTPTLMTVPAVPTISAASTTAIPTTTVSIASIPIQESPNVGLLCHYRINDPALRAAYSDSEDSNGEVLAKGSGVIVNAQGYILTAKHIVDPQWALSAYSGSIDPNEVPLDQVMRLDYCDVGVPPETPAPSTAMLQSLNPSIVLSNPFPYIARLVFEPEQDSMSNNEYNNLDFAVMKITGPMKNCELFNKCTLPQSFTYSPVLDSFTPDQSKQPNVLIDFGYPAEAINNSGGAFTDFYLKGAVGRLTTYYNGDQYFKDKPFGFDWEASDVLPGRSGSPVYWQGYVVGIDVSARADNSTMDYAVGMPAIKQILEENGLGQILMTH